MNTSAPQTPALENGGFVVGAKVAIISGGYNERFTAGTIEKVYKNGNFVLVGGHGQQWKHHQGVAHKTGDTSYIGRSYIRLWDASIEARVADQKARRETAQAVETLKEALAGRRTGNGDYHLTPEEVAMVRALTESIKSSVAS